MGRERREEKETKIEEGRGFKDRGRMVQTVREERSQERRRNQERRMERRGGEERRVESRIEETSQG